VHAAAHVVELHVGKVASGQPDAVRHRIRFKAPAVADVEREAECLGSAEHVAQAQVTGQVVDEYSGLGLEAEPLSRPLGLREYASAAVRQQLPGVHVRRTAGSRGLKCAHGDQK